MNIIIPMAGRGTRLRPHTLLSPKPLIKIAGKSIVQRLAEDLAKMYQGGVENIAFIIGLDFGKQVEQDLLNMAEELGAKGHICYQKEQLGTGHAILCAQEQLNGNVIVAFADTLFRTDFVINTEHEGVIWVQKVADPSAFGVIKLNNQGYISDFIEKPKDFVSDLAIIGIYYFRDGDNLKKELQYLVDNDIMEKGEYQLTRALENMKQKGLKFAAGEVREWLDFGNKEVVVESHARVLGFEKDKNLIDASADITNSTIIQPCFIGKNAKLENAVVGPFVSIGDDSIVKNVVISNSIIQNNTKIENCVLTNSMIGSHATVSKQQKEYSLGDYSTEK